MRIRRSFSTHSVVVVEKQDAPCSKPPPFSVRVVAFVSFASSSFYRLTPQTSKQHSNMTGSPAAAALKPHIGGLLQALSQSVGNGNDVGSQQEGDEGR